MGRNVRSHRISYSDLAVRGAGAGVLAAVFMGAVASIFGPLVSPESDFWSFFKVISTMVLGQDAADPLSGFSAAPVLVGLILHFIIGALLGTIFGVLVGLLGIEETVPVTLAGIVYGIVVFVPVYIGIAPLILPAFQDLPTMVILWAHVVFGLIAGALLGSWAELFDADHDATPAHNTRGLY